MARALDKADATLTLYNIGSHLTYCDAVQSQLT